MQPSTLYDPSSAQASEEPGGSPNLGKLAIRPSSAMQQHCMARQHTQAEILGISFTQSALARRALLECHDRQYSPRVETTVVLSGAGCGSGWPAGGNESQLHSVKNGGGVERRRGGVHLSTFTNTSLYRCTVLSSLSKIAMLQHVNAVPHVLAAKGLQRLRFNDLCNWLQWLIFRQVPMASIRTVKRANSWNSFRRHGAILVMT